MELHALEDECYVIVFHGLFTNGKWFSQYQIKRQYVYQEVIMEEKMSNFAMGNQK